MFLYLFQFLEAAQIHWFMAPSPLSKPPLQQLFSFPDLSSHHHIFLWLGLFFFFFNGFIFGCVGSSLLCAGFLQLQQTGATLRCSVRASHCGGFSCCGAQALSVQASVVVAHGLQQLWLAASKHRLSSCGARAQLLRGMWDLPGPGLEPMSPALAGGFLTTAPPGNPSRPFFICLKGTLMIILGPPR